MQKITPLSSDRHQALRWRKPDNFAFAADKALVGVTIAEIGDAAIAFPLVFVEQPQGFGLNAVLGVRPDRNLFVAQDGRWIGRHLPALLRYYPFLTAATESGERVVCIDEESAFVSQGGAGQRVFEDDGSLAADMKPVVDALSRLNADAAATARACAALAEAGVIEPWPLTLRNEQGASEVRGLFRINEAALVELGDETFLKLRKNGAVALAYAQLISMRNASVLGTLAGIAAGLGAGGGAASALASGGEIDLSWMGSGDFKLDLPH